MKNICKNIPTFRLSAGYERVEFVGIYRVTVTQQETSDVHPSKYKEEKPFKFVATKKNEVLNIFNIIVRIYLFQRITYILYNYLGSYYMLLHLT